MMKKMIFMVFLVVIALLATVDVQGSTLAKLKRKYPKAKVYTTMQIDKKPTILTKRKGKYTLIEITKGKCLNKKGDGRILNTTETYYNYISYRRVKGARKGSRITTYFVYDNSNEVDTIIERVDVITRR